MTTQIDWELRVLRGTTPADDVVEITLGDYVVHVRPAVAKRMGAQLMAAGDAAEAWHSER